MGWAAPQARIIEEVSPAVFLLGVDVVKGTLPGVRRHRRFGDYGRRRSLCFSPSAAAWLGLHPP